MAMLRNGDHAWLMYLRFDGDSSFVSLGDHSNHGTCSYTLANGQVDEYPLSACIDIEDCYKAIAYFFVNDGAQYNFVSWRDAVAPAPPRAYGRGRPCSNASSDPKTADNFAMML